MMKKKRLNKRIPKRKQIAIVKFRRAVQRRQVEYFCVRVCICVCMCGDGNDCKLYFVVSLLVCFCLRLLDYLMFAVKATCSLYIWIYKQALVWVWCICIWRLGVCVCVCVSVCALVCYNITMNLNSKSPPKQT